MLRGKWIFEDGTVSSRSGEKVGVLRPETESVDSPQERVQLPKPVYSRRQDQKHKNHRPQMAPSRPPLTA